MEKLVQEFRHHVHDSIYHENRFFGVVSEIKEDLKKLNPNANDSSSYYTQTQNIKNFKITPLEFQVDENCNYTVVFLKRHIQDGDFSELQF